MTYEEFHDLGVCFAEDVEEIVEWACLDLIVDGYEAYF